MLPGSTNWQIATSIKDECWVCEEHIITLFLWTPRIGILSMLKDEEEIAYYQEKVGDVNGQDYDH